MNQPDLYELCHTWCRLKTCDEKSALCLFKLFTDPNAAQRKLIDDPVTKKQAYHKQYDAERKAEKRDYDRERYLAKVEAKRAEAR